MKIKAALSTFLEMIKISWAALVPKKYNSLKGTELYGIIYTQNIIWLYSINASNRHTLLEGCDSDIAEIIEGNALYSFIEGMLDNRPEDQLSLCVHVQILDTISLSIKL